MQRNYSLSAAWLAEPARWLAPGDSTKTAEIILFERGPDISFANCGLPYHIGGTISDRDSLLVTTPEIMRRKYNFDVRTQTEVLSIDPKKREVVAKNLQTGEEYTESYDNLVLSPGAAPMRPPIPGIDNKNVLSLRNLQDMDKIMARIEGKKNVAVIGGGFIGLEVAEALRELGIGTTLIELAPQVMGPAAPEMATPLHQELRLFGVCSMSMDLMGIKREELIDGIDEGGVAMYIDQIGGNANLFI